MSNEERSSIENILSDVDNTIETHKKAKLQLAGLKHKLIFALIGFVLILALLITVNEIQKATAVKQLEANLKGQTFEGMDYFYELKLYDPENDLSYTFYGAESNFVFHDNNTVTWTCKYNRKQYSSPEYTEPVTTTHTYKVKYKGNFIYDSSALYIVLENGDILDVEYDRKDTSAKKQHRPSEVNYSVLYDENLHAPAALKDIDTSPVSSSSTPNKVPSMKVYKCNFCGGDGKTHDWGTEMHGSGYTCHKCGGKGWIEAED